MSLEFLAGCLGGCAGVVVGHPFDTVKVKLQTQDAKNPKYKGMVHCLSDTFKKESVRGLYRGMSSPMGGVAFVNAIIFGVHGNIMRNVQDPNSLRSHMLAGSTAGFVQAFIASPMELAKTRMQIMSDSVAGKALYKNPIDCLTKIFKAEGFKGIFRGQLVTIMREIPGFGTYFLSYEYMIRKMCRDGEITNGAILTAGGMAGIASWLTTYPIDVVKSRIQADGMFGPSKYKGIIHCVTLSVKTEGYGVLSRGLSTTIIRAFPTNAATFAVVNWIMNTCKAVEELEDPSLKVWEEFRKIGDKVVSSAGMPIVYAQAFEQGGMISPRLIFENNMIESTFNDKITQSKLVNFSEEENKSHSEIHECQSNDLGVSGIPKKRQISQVITEVNFCKVCGKCMKEGAQFIFNTSNSLMCLTMRQQVLSNTL